MITFIRMLKIRDRGRSPKDLFLGIEQILQKQTDLLRPFSLTMAWRDAIVESGTREPMSYMKCFLLIT